MLDTLDAERVLDGERGTIPKATRDGQNTVIQNTFADMGRRALKGIAEYLVAENAYENDLLTNIFNVDYLDGNREPTHLHPHVKLPVLVDDL